jgi:hypothetical protein
MPHQAYARNPFMMMINPEVVLAAVAKSERLGQLNRHLCRPLDKPVAPANGAGATLQGEDIDDGEIVTEAWETR